MKQDIKSLRLEELKRQLTELGEQAFRAKQVFRWLHRGVTSFDQMTDLSAALRRKLDERYRITVPVVERKQQSQLDGTIKYLWRLGDGNCVETVLMRYHHGNTVCISSQVGCRMGCAFCASTLGGLVRVLEPSELLAGFERKFDYTSRLVYLEELKTMPFAAVWDYYCLSENVPVGLEYFAAVREYENKVLAKR